MFGYVTIYRKGLAKEDLTAIKPIIAVYAKRWAADTAQPVN